MLTARIIILIVGYLIGSIQTGYFYGKTQGIDIRDHGSGNSGTTNTMRVLGKKAGFITFAGDCSKSLIAIFLAWLAFHNSYPEEIRLLMLYAGLAVILGHNYPFYMQFRGGKGIACTVGVAFAIVLPAVPLAAILFFGILFVTRYVSLCSVVTYSFLFLEVVFMAFTGRLSLPQQYIPEFLILFAFMTAMAIWRHRSNIKRLLAGNENKFSFGSK